MQDKNGETILVGDKVITPDGYKGSISMVGEDDSEPPKTRVLVALTIEGMNIIAKRKKGYYPEELEKVDPHEVSMVKCDLCSHTWVAVRPEGVTELECPNCNNLTQFENQIP